MIPSNECSKQLHMIVVRASFIVILIGIL